MAETPKILSALLAQLPDNTNEEISPEDLRDAVVSLWPSRGQLDFVATASTTFGAANTWTKLAGTTVLDTAVCSSCVSMPADNELRLLKAVPQVVLVTATIEVTCPSNNKTFSASIAKNGVVINACHVTQKIESAGAAYSFVITTLVATVQDDTLSVYVRNDTDTTTLTAQNYTLSVVGFVQ